MTSCKKAILNQSDGQTNNSNMTRFIQSKTAKTSVCKRHTDNHYRVNSLYNRYLTVKRTFLQSLKLLGQFEHPTIYYKS